MNSDVNTGQIWIRIIGSAAFGAVAMYALDPDKGKRRRARVGDKARSVVFHTRDAVGVATRDAAHRMQGLQARARRFLTDTPVPDDLQLIERVRARLGRLVSHPHAIQVGARNGRVTLSGPVLQREAGRLIDAVRSVWGAAEIENRLVVHERADSISSLQGRASDFGGYRALRHNAWPPATRMAAISSGAVMALYGMRRRSLSGCVMAGAGLTLALRGATGQRNRRMTLPAIDRSKQPTPQLPKAATSTEPGDPIVGIEPSMTKPGPAA